MRILSSSVSLASSVTTATAEVRRERSLFWVGDPPPQDGARAATATSTAAAVPRATPAVPATPAIPSRGDGPATRAVRATPATPGARLPAEAADLAEAGEPVGGREAINLLIMRRMFGLRRLHAAAQAVERAYAQGVAGAADAAAEVSRAEATAPAAAAPTRAGWGLEIDVAVSRTETTSVAFAAAASVTTADGRQIDAAAALAMEQVSTSASEVHLRAGDQRARVDPLALNLTGAPVALDGTQQLDLDGDGQAEEVAALASGSAWLARDLDGSGAVESGRELFGPASGDGFGELAALDQDGNGWIDEGDAAWADLALWDGRQLTSVSAAKIGAIYTGAAATPLALAGTDGAPGAQVQQTGLYLREDGTAGTVQHVDLET